MSLDREQLIRHCETIAGSRRIFRRIVVLCEGDIKFGQERPSPQAYRKMEKMPDSNFYKACVPHSWRQYKPQFFNCGDRKDVLDAYFTLVKKYGDSDDSYLDPEKLFAIVDLDIQTQQIENYAFSDTEQIFHDLYDGMNVRESNAGLHRIWVTGLVHKEAYFLLRELQTVFDEFPVPPLYKDAPVDLEKIYLDMIDAIGDDMDLRNNLGRVSERVRYCGDLDFTTMESVRESWKERFHTASRDVGGKAELIYALLTMRKAKEYWSLLHPSAGWTGSEAAFKDQLMLAIGRYYSKHAHSPSHHIPFFLQTLRRFEP